MKSLLHQRRSAEDAESAFTFAANVTATRGTSRACHEVEVRTCAAAQSGYPLQVDGLACGMWPRYATPRPSAPTVNANSDLLVNDHKVNKVCNLEDSGRRIGQGLIVLRERDTVVYSHMRLQVLP